MRYGKVQYLINKKQNVLEQSKNEKSPTLAGNYCITRLQTKLTNLLKSCTANAIVLMELKCSFI